MFFPLSLEKKEIFITNIDNGLSPIFKEKDIFNKRVDIPIENHPGSFGFVRKNHIHEGVDLYTNFLEPVYSISSGKIIDISQFTGEKVNSPWWNDTWAVLVEYDDFVINYGEIKPNKRYKKIIILLAIKYRKIKKFTRSNWFIIKYNKT